MFDIRDAEVAHEVARCGGFRAAAIKLGVAQSAVSARVAQLEASLGVTLFDRRHKGTRPTPVGRAFLDRTAGLIASRNEIYKQLSSDPKFLGTIRIGVIETVVHTWLDALLRNIHTTMNVRFELAVDTSEAIGRKLLDDEIDVAIVLDNMVPEQALGVHVYACQIAYYAAPDFQLPDEPLGLADLARLPIVTFPKGSLPYSQLEGILARGTDTQPLLHGCAALASTLRLIETGFGIGLLPAPMVDHVVPKGRVRPVATVAEARLADLSMSLCYLPAQPPSFVGSILEAVHSAVSTMHSI